MSPPPNTPNPGPPNAYFSTVLNPSTSTASAPSATTSPPRHRPGPGGVPGMGGTSGFGPTQQSLQARNKSYSVSPSHYNAEPYEQRQKRDEAATILDSLEMLIWYSSARNESISQTRQHFQNIVLGIPDELADDITWRDEWEVPAEERSTRMHGFATGSPIHSPARGSAKGKERAKKKV